MTLRIFKASHLILTGDAGTAPLWHNLRLCEFHLRKEGLFWARCGVKTVAQLYRGGSFKSFADFQCDYGVPGTADTCRFGIQRLLNLVWRISPFTFPDLGRCSLSLTTWNWFLLPTTPWYTLPPNTLSGLCQIDDEICPISLRKCSRKSYPYNPLWLFLPEIGWCKQNSSIALTTLPMFFFGWVGSHPPTALKCNGNVGSFYHMVWDCRCIQAYCSTITLSFKLLIIVVP